MLTQRMREATLADVPRIVEMGQRFRQESWYATRLRENPGQMSALAVRLITEPEGLFLVLVEGETLVGMMGCWLFAHHLSGDRTAGEVVFWIEPEHRGRGVRLMRAAEAWARAHGATTIQMIAPTVDVQAFYERLGYVALEVACEKVLRPQGEA